MPDHLSSPLHSHFDFETQSPESLNRDIELFEQIAAARAAFFDDIVEHAEARDPNTLDALRNENVYSMAEFFYLLRVFEINTSEKLRDLAVVHSQKLDQLLQNPAERERLGILPQRIRDAAFDTEEKLERLTINCRNGKIAFSQSDLARFMVEYMSTETCRHTARTLSEAGFFALQRSAFGAVLVSSNGGLEQIFGRRLRALRQSLETALCRHISR